MSDWRWPRLFKAIDLNGDVWLQAAEIWLRITGGPEDVQTEPGDEPKAWGSGNVWEDLGLPDPDDD